MDKHEALYQLTLAGLHAGLATFTIIAVIYHARKAMCALER